MYRYPEKIVKDISKKTKVILLVNFGRLILNLRSILKISKEHKIFVVEDATHTSHINKKIGSHGELVYFSFHPVKNLAMPTGGLISINTKNHKKITKILKEKRLCRISSRKVDDYDVKNIGWDNYINKFSADIDIDQLKKIDKTNLQRKKIPKNILNKFN